MSVGLGLLRKLVLENRSISYLSDRGFDAAVFEDEEVKVYNFVAKHYRKHGQVPKLKTIEKTVRVKFGKFPSEPMGYWMDVVNERRVANMVLDASSAMREAVTANSLDEARQLARDLVLALELHQSTDQIVTLQDAAVTVIKEHDIRQRKSDLGGVPFGIPYLDAVSDGAQAEDTVALVGRPGAGKSYILLMMALSAYLVSEIPLFLSMEMSVSQCTRRLLGLLSGVTTTLIRLGRLSPFARKILVTKYNDLVKEVQRPFHFLQGSLGSTVEDLAIKVQELRPTVLYVDGAYLLRSGSKSSQRWERVAETAEFLKVIAREFKIPVIATYQFNRRGPGSLGNIAFSDVIGQLASIVCGIDDDTEENQGSGIIGDEWVTSFYKLLMLMKGREGEKGVIRMLYDMQRMKIEQVAVVKGVRLIDDEGAEPED